MKNETTVYLGLGSNLGDRRAQLKAALVWLADHRSITIKAQSKIIETEPWGVKDQPVFLNNVVQIATTLTPYELLDAIKEAETDLGRSSGGPRWGPREIDIDILLFGDETIFTDRLTIPHAQLANRHFILEQLISIDKSLVHPILQVPLHTLYR